MNGLQIPGTSPRHVAWASETEVPSRVPGVAGGGGAAGRERVEKERLRKKKKPRAQRLSKKFHLTPSQSQVSF